MCRLSHVSGRVQGVGYRNFARRTALELGIRGYALNLADGRVEVMSCGESADLERFEQRLREGPRWAEVTEVLTRSAACTDSKDFRCA